MLPTTQINDRRAAAVFHVQRQRQILLALIPEPRSLTQLAKLTDTRLNLLHHHVGKLMRLGLVTVVREDARAGAPIKYYQATAASFFVPSELMDQAPGRGAAGELRRLMDRALSQTFKGVMYSQDGQGPRMRPVRDPEFRSKATELWLDLRLSAEDANELIDELKGLLHRFEARSRPSERRLIIHAAIAPV